MHKTATGPATCTAARVPTVHTAGLQGLQSSRAGECGVS
jgi:hypothetical protein